MREAEKETENVIFMKIKAYYSCLYNALLEIKLKRGDNIMTH